jgi:cytochrome c55X
MPWRWWREATAFALVAASAGSATADGTAPDPNRLTALVRQDCGSCHGMTLKGGLGKPLTADRLGSWDEDQLTRIILDGVPGTPMPPWRSLLSEKEARWIAEALRSGALQ